jgi:hypothetical protein
LFSHYIVYLSFFTFVFFQAIPIGPKDAFFVVRFLNNKMKSINKKLKANSWSETIFLKVWLLKKIFFGEVKKEENVLRKVIFWLLIFKESVKRYKETVL